MPGSKDGWIGSLLADDLAHRRGVAGPGESHDQLRLIAAMASAQGLEHGDRVIDAVVVYEEVVVVVTGENVAADPDLGQGGSDHGGEPNGFQRRGNLQSDPARHKVVGQPGLVGVRRSSTRLRPSFSTTLATMSSWLRLPECVRFATRSADRYRKRGAPRGRPLRRKGHHRYRAAVGGLTNCVKSGTRRLVRLLYAPGLCEDGIDLVRRDEFVRLQVSEGTGACHGEADRSRCD